LYIEIASISRELLLLLMLQLWVQVAFIGSMSRLLQHASAEELSITRQDWRSALDTLPLHPHRLVREAFQMQIHCFTRKQVLQGVLGSKTEDSNNTSWELELLGILRHASCIAEDSDVIETVLQSVAEIAKTVGHSRQFLFFALVLLLEQLDRREVSLRALSVTLIHKVASSGFKGSGGTARSIQARFFAPLYATNTNVIFGSCCCCSFGSEKPDECELTFVIPVFSVKVFSIDRLWWRASVKIFLSTWLGV
jgi:hypothetical protein